MNTRVCVTAWVFLQNFSCQHTCQRPGRLLWFLLHHLCFASFWPSYSGTLGNQLSHCLEIEDETEMQSNHEAARDCSDIADKDEHLKGLEKKMRNISRPVGNIVRTVGTASVAWIEREDDFQFPTLRYRHQHRWLVLIQMCQMWSLGAGLFDDTRWTKEVSLLCRLYPSSVPLHLIFATPELGARCQCLHPASKHLFAHFCMSCVHPPTDLVRGMNLPSTSTSLIISMSSASVGFCPRDLITMPSSLVEIDPFPSLSNSWNASLNSKESITMVNLMSRLENGNKAQLSVCLASERDVAQ